MISLLYKYIVQNILWTMFYVSVFIVCNICLHVSKLMSLSWNILTNTFFGNYDRM